MSFELLDDVLLENGLNVNTKEVITEDSAIFSELDALVENAMRETLRNTIYSSDNEPVVKLEHLEVVESAEFTEEQLNKFMDKTIYPILEMAGVLSSDNHIIVSLPIYETAALIEQAEEDETDEEEAEEELKEIADFYGKDSDELFTEAHSLLKKHKLSEMAPSISDLAILISEAGDIDDEKIETEATLKIAPPGGVTGKRAKLAALRAKLAGKARDIKGRVVAAAGRAGTAAKGKWGKLGKKTKIGVGVGAALTVAALAAAAALAYKRKNDKCGKIEDPAGKSKCKKSAAGDAIKLLNAQKAKCKDAKNPAKCASGIDGQVSKWKERMSSY